MTAAAEARWLAASAHASSVVVAVGAVLAVRAPVLLAVVAAPLGPLVVAALSRSGGAFARGHVREAVRFSARIAFISAGVVLGLLLSTRVDAFAWLFWPLLFCDLLLVFLWLSFVVVACAAALRGREWRDSFASRRRRSPGDAQ